MILADTDIQLLAEAPGGDMIHPFVRERLQPASYDCTLGKDFQVFSGHGHATVDPTDPESYEGLSREIILDTIENPERFLVLHPDDFVLGTTAEFFRIPHDITARIEGKSSLGRLGLLTHVTAGFIDPGFEGTVTLEFKNLLRVPILLRPGMPICQMSFTALTKAARKPYSGRYQGSRGAVASRSGADHE